MALFVTGLVIPVDSAIALPVTGSATPDLVAGVTFWALLTLLASALPVQLSSGVQVAVSTAPLMAATILGGPTAGAIAAAFGTFDAREVRGRVPWYGTLANHAAIVLPVIVAGLLLEALKSISDGVLWELVAALLATLVYFLGNLVLVSLIVVIRGGNSIREFWTGAETSNLWANLVALAPLGWLMAHMYETGPGWWTTILFGVPLFTTRLAYQRFVEMREMFTQTIGALAEAVDKRDPFTSKHSQRVRLISVDIGREMRVSAAELEALEWGGLLHDVGKIGVPDSVLLKQGKLTREERMIMNAHPVLGAQIIGPVDHLAAELPVIRHHHEWYNGSGYPDRLIGDEIPRLARILHVADAYEAMTADRPYRKALSNEQAVSELRKFAGVQFDPEIVDAFMRTSWAAETRDPGRPELRPIPLLGQVAAARSGQAFDAPAPGSPAADLA
ncbi:MAG TPA: HD-GYP domain-containing protein [Candidatus Limnocylindrales bacterium]|nr:HD-GYP domain-containing protein [Candidatus Limnocylindrales bacterium]